MKKLKMLSLIIFGFVVLSGCCESPSLNPNDHIFEINQFPLAVGNEWVYQFIDSTKNEIGKDTTLKILIDTVSLKIISKEIKDNNTIYNCIVTGKYPIHNDTGKFVYLKNKIEYQNNNGNSFLGFILHFPLKVGNIWSETFAEYFVKSINSTIQVLDKKYSNSYLLSVIGGTPNTISQLSLSISPGVGVLKIYSSSDDYFKKISTTISIIKFIKA